MTRTASPSPRNFVTRLSPTRPPTFSPRTRGWVAERLAKGQQSENGLSFNELRLLGGGAEEVGFDATGRAVLLNWMKEETGITKHAFFYGSVTNFEIWDPHTLLGADDSQAAPVLKRICRNLMQERNLL